VAGIPLAVKEIVDTFTPEQARKKTDIIEAFLRDYYKIEVSWDVIRLDEMLRTDFGLSTNNTEVTSAYIKLQTANQLFQHIVTH